MSSQIHPFRSNLNTARPVMTEQERLYTQGSIDSRDPASSGFQAQNANMLASTWRGDQADTLSNRPLHMDNPEENQSPSSFAQNPPHLTDFLESPSAGSPSARLPSTSCRPTC